jgi:hypothetical protein
VPADVPTTRPTLPPAARASGIIRPRTAGEILDDAWRLYLANAPLLLALSGLFTVPAAVALLLLLTQPRPAGVVLPLILPAVTAALLPLTGLGSGACQEVFRLQAEGKPAGLFVCLRGALARGLDHVAARAVVLAATLLGLGVLVMPGLAVWAGAAGVHPILAEGRGRLFDALAVAAREAPVHAGKAVVVTLCRLPMLALAVLNLLAVVEAGLWVAGNLGGLDTSLASLLLSMSNPACLAGFVLLAWLLLAPFAEASNFLLHVDARARYEGLDLWYRVQQLFPVAERGRSLAVLLALGAMLVLAPTAAGRAAPARPADRLTVVREVREKVDAIRHEVEQAKPYPGGNRWLPALRDLARRLDPAGGPERGPYRWFYQGLEGFAARDQQGAVEVLTELGRRLETAEQSLDLAQEGPEGGRPALSKDEIKGLVPKRDAGGEAEDGQPQKAAEPEAKHEPRRPVVRRDDEDDAGPEVRRGPGVVPAAADAGFSFLAWLIVAGVLLAIVALAIMLAFQRRAAAAPAAAKTESGKKAASLDDVLSRPEPQTAQALWRQAEQLAAAGNYLEAVRLLYAAVLATLSRAGMIRYEAMRTNGEYADQLRAHPQAPDEVHESFGRLTGLFELKWYGERACRPEDYRDCRGLAERIRGLV